MKDIKETKKIKDERRSRTRWNEREEDRENKGVRLEGNKGQKGKTME